MAKRKRLTPLPFDAADTGPDRPFSAALETKSALTPGSGLLAHGTPVPIARVAGEAAASAAFDAVADELRRARAEGRLIQDLPLNALVDDYLVRDRILVADDELAALRSSILARGQQTPIEVADLGGGRFGLISGWRRLTVIRTLSLETGASAFATIRALVRHPAQASEAYVAMVEENEIRVGLSYYERARIVLKSYEQGVFATEKKALYGLFSTASKAKRSKIGSFITVVRHLDGALAFPVRLPERLGLVLARALEADDRLAGRIAARLAQARPADAPAEQALIATILAPPVAEAAADPTPTLDRPKDAEEIAPGVYLQTGGGLLRPRYTLSGPRVDADFLGRLVSWLQDGG